MTVEQMAEGGELTKKYEWTDGELKLMISATECALAYLKAKGSRFELATVPLMQDLELYKGFAQNRKET